jgi:hypothetical protein
MRTFALLPGPADHVRKPDLFRRRRSGSYLAQQAPSGQEAQLPSYESPLRNHIGVYWS